MVIAESNPATVFTLFLMDEVFCRSVHVQAPSKTKTGKMIAAQILSKSRKEQKILQGAKRGENKINNKFVHGRRIFWGLIWRIEFNKKALWENIKKGNF